MERESLLKGYSRGGESHEGEPRSTRKILFSAAISILRVVFLVALLLLVFSGIVAHTSSGSGSSDGNDSSSCGYGGYTTGADECNEMSSVALEGVDVVAYFDAGASGATKGSSAYQEAYRGYTFYFASAAHAASFTADPEAYAPKYGGFCAFGLSGEDPMNEISKEDELYTVRGGLA